MSDKHEDHIERINQLLRGEMSAVETYQQALDKIDSGPEADQLRSMLNEHKQAVSFWQGQVVKHGGVPSEDSGLWGSWAQLVQGTAKVFGPETAMAALKQGEEHGIADYERALEDESVTPDCKSEIRERWMPTTRAHIDKLDRLMAAH